MVAKTSLVEWQVSMDWRLALAEWDRRQGKSEHTVKAHQQDLGVFAEWYALATGSEFEPGQLNSFDLRRFRAWQLDTQAVQPATWNRRLASLRVLADWARKSGAALPEDLFDGVLSAEKVPLPPDWLTDAEYDRLARYLESTAFDPYDDRTAARRLRALRNRALAAVMLYAGLREAEAADLLVGDVDLSERKGKITVRRGKGQKRREVPLADAGLRKVLRRYLEEAVPTGFLFANETGGRLSERAIQESVGDIGLRCRVEDLRPHRLRHTCGKRMADAGVQLQVIASLLGHASLEVTRRYVQPGEEDLREAIAMVSQGKLARNKFTERSEDGRKRRG